MRIEWKIKDFFIPKDKIEDYFETLEQNGTGKSRNGTVGKT